VHGAVHGAAIITWSSRYRRRKRALVFRSALRIRGEAGSFSYTPSAFFGRQDGSDLPKPDKIAAFQEVYSVLLADNGGHSPRRSSSGIAYACGKRPGKGLLEL